VSVIVALVDSGPIPYIVVQPLIPGDGT